MKKIKFIAIRLEEEKHKKLKRYAMETNQSMQQIIEGMINITLGSHGKSNSV